MVQVSDTYSIQRKMMTIMGVWHVENESFFFLCRKIFTWTVFLITFVAMIIEFAYDVTDFERLSQTLYLLLSFLSYFCKLLGFTYNRKGFLAMLAHLEDPLFVSFPSELDKCIIRVTNVSKLVTKLYMSTCGVCALMYPIYPIFDNKSLPIPFPYELGGYTPVMYAIQSSAVLTATWINVCLDTLCVSLMGLAYSEFDVLKHKIINIRKYAVAKLGKAKKLKDDDVDQEIDDMVHKMLNNCIRHHCAIITFVEQVETIFSFGILGQFLGSIIVICNTGFFLLTVSPSSFQFALLSLYFISMMCQLTLYCWYGNEIIRKSVEINDACYLSKWYTFGPSVRKLLFIIMERSKRPSAITAWKFADVSLTSYGAIMQWSYSYFALLQKVAQEDT